MAYMARLVCTERNGRRPESQASSSWQASPYARAPIPAQPYPSRFAPRRPSFASSGTSSWGKRPSLVAVDEPRHEAVLDDAPPARAPLPLLVHEKAVPTDELLQVQ